MHTSKRFIDLILSFLFFFLTSIAHFIKLITVNTYIYGRKLISTFDKAMCCAKHSFIIIFIVSFILNISLEASLRKSIPAALALIFRHPAVFFLGFLIVLFTFSLIYLFKKRSFFMVLISVIWIIINCVSYFMMRHRTTPFNASDLRVLHSVSDIINAYLSKFEIFLLIFAIVLLFALLIFIFIKSGKAKRIISFTAIIPLVLCCLTTFAVSCNIKYSINSDRFDNLPNKFKEHGFVFCFFYSIIDTGIEKPHDYSHQTYVTNREQVMAVAPSYDKPQIQQSCNDNDLIKQVYNMVLQNYATMPSCEYYGISPEIADTVSKHLQDKFTSSPNLISDNHSEHISTFPESFELPNIIFVQLESFYDVNNIGGYHYSKEPHPIYSLLKENLPGGLLTVPSIGAGTANTEFEILTGMDVSLFGIAEYPYLSVLQNNTCESMAYNTKEYGYTSHVIHNHKGTFYDRHKVFPNLGFDTFTSVENTPFVIKNRNNWAKDAILISPILESLDSTEGQDLIYAISVQPHGKYPSESKYESMLDGSEPFIKVTGNENNPENPGFTYYVNELYESDNFIGNLLLELSFRNEPTILIMYGDHLPAFSVQQYWDLKEGNCYQTDYFIWNNCNIDFSDATDLKTFQLSSYIFSKLGINSGDFNILNRLYLQNDTNDYTHLRHIYQYAILYDNSLKKNTDIDIPRYEKTDIDYGIFDISISGIFTIDGKTYIQGKNFNNFSVITVNGKQIDTDFISSSLITTNKALSSGDEIGVIQLGMNSAILGESENTLKYSGLMVVSDNIEKDSILESILPVKDDFVFMQDDFIQNDATKDFVTGADEFSMIQPDITKQNNDDSEVLSSTDTDSKSDLEPEYESDSIN